MHPDIRAGSVAYFTLAVLLPAGVTMLAFVRPSGPDALDAGSLLLAFFTPFAIAMGLRRGERWARWLGFRLGLGLAGAAALGTAGEVSELVSEVAALDPASIARLATLPPISVIAGFAAWRLGSREARAAMRARPE